MTLKERLLKNIIKKSDGCWIWQGYKKNGYGSLSINNYDEYAHRISFQVFVGEVTEGKHVCHKCDVPACINPDHLFLGTHKDNVADMWQKGRGKPPVPLTGMDNFQAKLSDNEVQEIIELKQYGFTQRELARRFGCSQSTIGRLVNGKVRAA